MKTFSATLIATLALIVAPLHLASAQEDPPAFMAEIFPETALDAAWKEFQAVMVAPGTLGNRAKELIALGVAAQIPCDYCVYYHTRAAQTHGATDAEIREALAVAATVRKWSTMLNGSMYDYDDWRDEVDAMFNPGDDD